MVIISGSSPDSTRPKVSIRRSRPGGSPLKSAASDRFFLSRYSRALISSPRSMAIVLPRVPGDLPPVFWAAGPIVAATARDSTITASSTVRPVVLATSVCPDISSPGACPVWIVVTPKLRSHSIRSSWGL